MSLDPSSSPLAFFGAELRRFRDRAGMTQATLAEATSYSLPAVSAFETARRIPFAEFAASADKALSADGSLIRLQALVEQTSVLPWFRDRIEVEKSATEISEYDGHQIPGLLQAEDYMRHAIRAGRPALRSDDAERAITLRLTRQEILEPDEFASIDRPSGKRLWAIIDESALRRVVGSPAVMGKQMSHLADMAGRPNITVQIMPLSEGVTCAYGRAFSILAGGNSPVVYLDDIFGDVT
jgi:transcriptional regulator with XRE-family HTH domain